MANNNPAKPVLAFDTSLGGCVVAVLAGDKVVERSLPTDREQAARLIPLIQDAMAEAGSTFADLGLIVTSVGPGSFTGLRISLSTARSFGLALNIPVHGVSGLALMAACCHREGDTGNSLVLLETKRQDFYVQSFNAAREPLTPPTCASLTDILAQYDLSNVILCGDAVDRFVAEAATAGHNLQNETRMRSLFDPATLARFGADDFARNGNIATKPQPVYLRGADVSVSNKIQREIEGLSSNDSIF